MMSNGIKEVLGALGYQNNMESGRSAGFNDGKNTDFWISEEKSIVPTHLAAAFALDRDGNNIEAVWYDPRRAKAE